MRSQATDADRSEEVWIRRTGLEARAGAYPVFGVTSTTSPVCNRLSISGVGLR
jgi:hypothetical protein